MSEEKTKKWDRMFDIAREHLTVFDTKSGVEIARIGNTGLCMSGSEVELSEKEARRLAKWIAVWFGTEEAKP